MHGTSYSSPRALVGLTQTVPCMEGSQLAPRNFVMGDIPFLGFSESRSFGELSQSSGILFRLQFSGSQTVQDVSSPLIAPRYVDVKASDLSSIPSTYAEATYAEVIRHLDVYKDMQERNFLDFQTPWISSTFHFPFIIWEASRRLMYRFAKGMYKGLDNTVAIELSTLFQKMSFT